MYIRIGNDLYPAIHVSGSVRDRSWDERMSKSITLRMTYDEAVNVFVEDLEWSIIDDEQNEYDNREYSIAGDITDHRDGYITVKMGKATDLEEAYKHLYGRR